MTRRTLLPLLATVLLALVAAEPALACSCAPSSPREDLRRADAAIVGRLVDVRPRSGGTAADYVYRVRRVHKGRRRVEEGELLRVRSARDEAACGLPTERRRYGLFLERTGRGWSSNLCSVVSPRKLRRAARGEAQPAGTCDGA